MLYKQSPARRAIMGHEQTRNPSPAAAAILQRAFGGKRLKRALRRAPGLFGRRRHRNNPAPAIVATLAKFLGPSLGGLFKKPSEQRAQGVAGAVIQAANAGNLVAARGLIDRAAKPMKVAESTVWKAAVAQLSARIRGAVQKYEELIPAADQSSPEAFAASVLSAPPVDLEQLEAQAAESVRMTKAERAAAARESGAAAERREARLLDVGGQIGSALLGRGRRPRTRRKPRRKRRQSFSF